MNMITIPVWLFILLSGVSGVGFIFIVKDLYQSQQQIILHQRISILLDQVLKSLNYDAVVGDPLANGICAEADAILELCKDTKVSFALPNPRAITKSVTV
jgi:hypothetical protein